MASDQQLTPEVLWAQRSNASVPEKNLIYLTISAPDVSSKACDIKLEPTSLTFTGKSETKKTTYHVKLEFFAEVDVENSKTIHSPRDVEFVLRKKEAKEEFWPRLLKAKEKVHFLKTNFDKWVDEDEQDGAPDDDVPGYGGGMPDMGGMSEEGGFGGIDFSKLGGGAGGMPDFSGMGGEGDDDDVDDDDDMPGLEGEDDKAEDKDAAADKGKGKISEVDDAAEKVESKAKIEEMD